MEVAEWYLVLFRDHVVAQMLESEVPLSLHSTEGEEAKQGPGAFRPVHPP